MSSKTDADIVRIIEKKDHGPPMGQSLLAVVAFVLHKSNIKRNADGTFQSDPLK